MVSSHFVSYASTVGSVAQRLSGSRPHENERARNLLRALDEESAKPTKTAVYCTVSTIADVVF